MSTRIEDLVVREKSLYPNVDLYSASTYYVMRVPLEIFTPIFAVSRVVGWSAHVLEQYANNRLIRPMSDYVGPMDKKFTAIDQRVAGPGI
jgi:citrate synthase